MNGGISRTDARFLTPIDARDIWSNKFLISYSHKKRKMSQPKGSTGVQSSNGQLGLLWLHISISQSLGFFPLLLIRFTCTPSSTSLANSIPTTSFFPPSIFTKYFWSTWSSLMRGPSRIVLKVQRVIFEHCWELADK